jgi:hypothetical protein
VLRGGSDDARRRLCASRRVRGAPPKKSPGALGGFLRPGSVRNGERVILVALAWLVATACVVASVRRLGVVSALARDSAVADGIERASRERLLAKLPGDNPLGRTAREVLDAPSGRAAIAQLNEALSDVARELDLGGEIPKSASRVALASGALAGIVELARRIPVDGAGALGTAGVAFAAGIAGGFFCVIVGRSAEDRARRCRADWDRLSRSLERLLGGGADVGGPRDIAGPGSVL